MCCSSRATRSVCGGRQGGWVKTQDVTTGDQCFIRAMGLLLNLMEQFFRLNETIQLFQMMHSMLKNIHFITVYSWHPTCDVYHGLPFSFMLTSHFHNSILHAVDFDLSYEEGDQRAPFFT